MMKKDFRIVLVSPENYGHLATVRELIIGLCTSIKKLGYNCEVKFFDFDYKKINIIVGYHLVPYDSIPKDLDYVVLQLEQFFEEDGIFSVPERRVHILDILKSAYKVWDVFIYNIDFLKKYGIEANYLKIGYSEALEELNINTKKTIDVLFYGAVNERRRKILDEIETNKIRFKYLFGVYGEERNKYIEKSRIVLNIHSYNYNYFESVRVSYLLNNGIPVLSEFSKDYPWENVPLLMVKKEEIVSALKNLLKQPKELKEYGILCKELFKKYYPQEALIEPLIKEL